VVEIPVPRTIVDGAQTTYLGAWNFPIIRSLVSDIVTVTDDLLVQMMRFVTERLKIIVEPTPSSEPAVA
jgi:threo-3-hydroxy-L-aspartate ammonia-lyase